jgi:hypothetical protein
VTAAGEWLPESMRGRADDEPAPLVTGAIGRSLTDAAAAYAASLSTLLHPPDLGVSED